MSDFNTQQPSRLEKLSVLLRRRRFAVIGYSAEDETYCPACLRFSTGLSPGKLDTNNKPVLPLYARDETMHDERCTSCHRNLLDLLLDPDVEPTVTVPVPAEKPLPVEPRPPIIRRHATAAA
jgi:hypothetical protein